MSVVDKIKSVRTDFFTDFESFPNDKDKINQLKTKYLGRKGVVTNLFKLISDVKLEDKALFGQSLNNLKNEIIAHIESKELVSNRGKGINSERIDLTLPAKVPRIGANHILEKTLVEVKNIFKSIGFSVAYGPEVDDDYHNFSALNIPEYHPARDMQDTFFVNDDLVLRTHTSNVQIHLMEQKEPPLRYIVPGRVFRNESISFKNYCLFHQVEGIYINRDVSFAQLKGCLEYFVKKIFGKDKRMRFRPSYFPFTEPSAEVDMWNDDRGTWMEILGCGMVDPNVLENVGYDPKIWKGYAFGMGIERIAMLKYGINDIRLFYNGDIRFLDQFK